MQQFLKKFDVPTKCSDKECRTMITEAHNDLLLCDTCYEIWKRFFRIRLLEKFGYVSPHLESGSDRGRQNPYRRSDIDYGYDGFP